MRDYLENLCDKYNKTFQQGQHFLKCVLDKLYFDRLYIQLKVCDY